MGGTAQPNADLGRLPAVARADEPADPVLRRARVGGGSPTRPCSPDPPR